MAIKNHNSSSFLTPSSFLLLLLLTCSLHVDVAEAQDCPNECSCFNNFVSCFEFTEQNLLDLPASAETLVLNSGNIPSFPPGFARRFPQLTMLDIQSSRIQTILNDSFSGLAGLDQLAFTDCQIGTIETGAFEDISAVTQVFFSGSQLGTIRSGAFSRLSNVGEFNMWSNQIQRVESGAFSRLSNLGSFAFYENNVTTWHRNAFASVENLGKADVFMNKFFNAKGSAVMPVQAATSDMNMYSNTFPCNCGIVRDFNAPLLKRYLVSQKCIEDGRVFRLSEMKVDEVCSNQPSSTPFSSSSSTSSTTLGMTRKSTTTPDIPSLKTTTPIKVTKIVYLTSTSSGGKAPTTTSPTRTSRSSLSASLTSTVSDRSSTPDVGVTNSGKGQSSGQSGNSANGAKGLVGTQLSLVPWLTSLVAVLRFVSVRPRVN